MADRGWFAEKNRKLKQYKIAEMKERSAISVISDQKQHAEEIHRHGYVSNGTAFTCFGEQQEIQAITEQRLNFVLGILAKLEK